MSTSRTTQAPRDSDTRTYGIRANTTQPVTMATWSEPTVKSLQPSFKEYPHLNIERHGVLLEMAPLGTMPSLKLKKAARQSTPKPAPVVKQVEEVKELEVEAAREPLTPDPVGPVAEERVRSESAHSPHSVFSTIEYNPPKTPQQQSHHRKSFSQTSHQGHSTQGQMSPSISASASPSKPQKAVHNIDKTVNMAIHYALSVRRYPTAYALRTLYDEFTGVERIVSLFEAIFYQSATPEQTAEFNNLMTLKKKEGRKDGKAIAFFANGDPGVKKSSPTNSRSYSVTSPVSQKPTPRPLAIGNSLLSPSIEGLEKFNHITKKQKSTEYRSPYVATAPPVPIANGRNYVSPFAPLPLVTPRAPEPRIIDGVANGTSSQPRSASISSESSLSSVDEEIAGSTFISPPSKSQRLPFVGPRANDKGASNDGQTRITTTTHQPSQTSHANSHANSATEDNLAPAFHSNQRQPMTLDKSLGPNSHAFPTSTSSTTTKNSITPDPLTPSATTQVANDDPSMATQVQTANSSVLFPALFPSAHTAQSAAHPSKTVQTKLKFGKKAAVKPSVEVVADDEAGLAQVELLKSKAKATTESQTTTESHEREGSQLNGRLNLGEDSDISDAVADVSIKSAQTLRLRPSNNKRKLDDVSEALSSPILPLLSSDVVETSTPNSRAGTPNPSKRSARTAKSSGPRMKTSPMKNKAGPSAGIPRASGERNSPAPNSTTNGQDDNEDFCSSCGGSGDLVCCDGCPRSFHLKCVDPPMIEGHLPDTWFCNVCNSVRGPPIREEPGPFGKVVALLEKKNSSAFSLPRSIRQYFDGVRTGPEGEYEEGPIPVAVSKAKNRNGYDEPPDYLKQRDAKGDLILCHNCKEGPGTKRSIITCSFCSAPWHLDCLNPPLANPPHPSRQWRCPLHVNDLLVELPSALGPAHRFRRIKGTTAIKPDIARGTKNNGHIEVDLDSTDDEDEGFFDRKEFGHVYKLPEEGIKLDFISKLRTMPFGTPRKEQHPQPMATFSSSRHSLAEQQAALNMVALTSADDDAQRLIDVLMAEAPSAVINMIAQGDAANIAAKKVSNKDKQSLKAMMALIMQRLDDNASEDEKMQVDDSVDA